MNLTICHILVIVYVILTLIVSNSNQQENSTFQFDVTHHQESNGTNGDQDILDPISFYSTALILIIPVILVVVASVLDNLQKYCDVKNPTLMIRLTMAFSLRRNLATLVQPPCEIIGGKLYITSC